MKRQVDGFSLVEVIVAIAILAIVAMSMLSYFSGASRYAGKGNSTQKGDMAAQSVVEELASCTTMKQIEEMVAASGSAWKVDAAPSPKEKKYKLRRPVAVGDTEYQARVTLDFDSYMATAKPDPTPTMASEFNRYEVPQLEEVYAEGNVVLEETDQTNVAVGELFAQIYKTDETKSDEAISRKTIRSGLKRAMYIHIEPCAEEDSTDSTDLYLVKGYYRYWYEESGKTYECEVPIRVNKIEKDTLKKVYLFYRPVSSSLSSETLDITAATGIDLTDFSFFAILQKDEVTPPAKYRLNFTSPSLKLHTNANPALDELITHKAEDRIAMVTVEIYHKDELYFNEENRIVMVQTSKGV